MIFTLLIVTRIVCTFVWWSILRPLLKIMKDTFFWWVFNIRRIKLSLLKWLYSVMWINYSRRSSFMIQANRILTTSLSYYIVVRFTWLFSARWNIAIIFFTDRLISYIVVRFTWIFSARWNIATIFFTDRLSSK